MNVFLFLAQEQNPQSGGWLQLLSMLAIMFAIFYFLLIRPQQKRENERQGMLAKIKKNDRVLTNGGIFGTVVNVKDGEVILRIDEAGSVRVRFEKSAVVRVVEPSAEEGKAAN